MAQDTGSCSRRGLSGLPQDGEGRHCPHPPPLAGAPPRGRARNGPGRRGCQGPKAGRWSLAPTPSSAGSVLPPKPVFSLPSHPAPGLGSPGRQGGGSRVPLGLPASLPEPGLCLVPRAGQGGPGSGMWPRPERGPLSTGSKKSSSSCWEGARPQRLSWAVPAWPHSLSQHPSHRSGNPDRASSLTLSLTLLTWPTEVPPTQGPAPTPWVHQPASAESLHSGADSLWSGRPPGLRERGGLAIRLSSGASELGVSPRPCHLGPMQVSTQGGMGSKARAQATRPGPRPEG